MMIIVDFGFSLSLGSFQEKAMVLSAGKKGDEK